MNQRDPPNRAVLATISFAISVLCAVVIVLLIHDRWSHRPVDSAEQAEHATTGMAARNSGSLPQNDPNSPVQSANPR